MSEKNQIVNVEPVDCSSIEMFSELLLAKSNTANILTIESVKDLECANNLKIQIRDDIKKVEDARLDITRPLNKTISTIKGMYDAIKVKPQEALKKLDDKILIFTEKQEKEAENERRRIEIENKKEVAKLEKRKDRATKPETVERIEQEIEEKENFSGVPRTVSPKVKGLTIITEYDVVVTDIEKVPDMFIIKTVDDKLLRAMAKRKEGDLKIEGINFVKRQRTVSRGR